MKKKIYFFLGLIISIILVYSCSRELDNPTKVNTNEKIKFNVDDAHNYFETNATDLSQLILSKNKTKNISSSTIDLKPCWDNAIKSGHENVSLIEIPLSSGTTLATQGYDVKNGMYSCMRQVISTQRLIVAKTIEGAIDMFIVTIVPTSNSRENNTENLSNFRYLGGSNFSGHVFCSTLDGVLVKGFVYENGENAGVLEFMLEDDLTDEIKSHLTDHDYTSYDFRNIAKTKSGTYSFTEWGSGAGGNMGTVIVTAKCSICRLPLSSCLCPMCQWCFKKGDRCKCVFCTRCKKPTRYCECYIYPGGGTGGGGSTGGGTGGVTPTSPPPLPEGVFYDLSDESKYVGYVKGKRDCLQNAKEILNKYGITNYGSSDKVYKLMSEINGKLTNFGNNADRNYLDAIECIDRHLKAKRPIIVGVNHTLGKTINEGATDHFVLIVGRGYDFDLNQGYYTYVETGRLSTNAKEACNTSTNRLYYTTPPPLFEDTNSYLGENPKKYQITQVRPNDGNTNGTVNQKMK